MYIHKERYLQLKFIDICCHIAENYDTSQEFQNKHESSTIDMCPTWRIIPLSK